MSKKLVVSNDWESLSYTWCGKPLTSVKGVRMGYPADGESGGAWHKARFQKVHRTYSDMGHESTVTTHELQVYFDLLGAWVPLTEKALILEIE